MPEQSTFDTQTTQPSNLPVITLVLAIALWYAWGLGLVLIGVVW